MDETVITTQESAMDTGTPVDTQPTDQTDDFLAGFDDEPETTEQADQPEETGQADEPAQETEETTEAESEGEQAAASEAAAGTAETPAAPVEGEKEQPQQESQKTWTLKHMGEQLIIADDDERIPTLLQKGLDYDRIRPRFDEMRAQMDKAKPALDVLNAEAARRGVSLEDYVRDIRIEMNKAQGMDETQARRAVELDDREAALNAQRAQEQEAANAQAAKDARIRADLDEFGRAFPEVYNKARGGDKTAIPQSVWDEVNRGLSLTAAYSRHVAAQAEAQVKAANERANTAAKNAENAHKSTGSMKSAGQDAKITEAFLEGFDG